MARYIPKWYRRRKVRSRRRIYIISALVVIVAVVVFVYGANPFGKDKDETAEALITTGTLAEREASLPAPAAEPESDLPEVAPETISEPNSEVAELIDEAMACINSRPARIIEARDRLNELLPMHQSRRQREFVKEQLSQLADKWLFSRTIFMQDRLCKSLQVKPGDQLRTIGRQFKVPYEILMQINNIDRPEALQAGETIKVINGPFHARIYRSTFTMDLYLQNTFIRSFTVGLGKEGRETPTGLWVVEPGGKVISPTWTDPDTGKVYHPEDPDYPLGSRWIGLKGLAGEAKDRTGIAFHGWKNSDLMAEGGSRGCVRLHNGDVILLYNLLMQGFSQVEIVE